MSSLRVLIVNPVLYHYRRGVFCALDRCDAVEATFASDVRARNGISVMDPAEVRRHIPIRAARRAGLEWQSGLLKLLFRGDYTHVIFLGDVATISTWLGAAIARARGMRVAFWTIGWHRPERGVKRAVRLAFYRLAHVLLLYGGVARQIGEALGYPVRRMRVIGNSVDAFPPVPDRAGFDLPVKESGVLWIGAVIRLSTVKRLDLLIDAASTLRSEGRDVRVLLVGSGPEEARLRAAAARAQVPIDLPGPAYSASDLSRVYSVLDITVVPAAIGLTAVQSIAHGTPVISDDDRYSQMPEWESIRPGVTGDHFGVGDTAHLAAAVLRVATDIAHDPGKVAAACRAEYRERWSPEAHAARIVEALASDDSN